MRLWLGVVKAGTQCTVPVISTDFYDTFTEVGGGDPEATPAIDGLSLVPLLKGETELPREALYWHFPHRGKIGNSGAIRKGKFKLIEKFATNEVELYDLSDDIGEKNNLAAQMPEEREELLNELTAWRKETGAKIQGRK
jgi:arylsulfatase A-like enzyme